MPKLSIIVPIYNVENYLEQCLESIRVQTFKDWECLLFSDGSKDGSINIMKRFSAQDSRFKVIEKQNEGYGATCNRGLDMAQGEWVCVVEPDDFIDPHMYENLLSANHSDKGAVDIVKGSYWLYYDAQPPYTEALQNSNLSLFMPTRETDFTLEEFTTPFYHHPSIWSAIYRRDFLNGDNKASRKIRFKPIPGAGWTDNPFFAETFVLADRIKWVPGRYYYYRQTNPGASTFIKDFRLPFDRLRDMREFLESQHVSKEIMRAFYSREFDYVTSVIGEFGYDDKNPEIRKLIHEVFNSMDRDEVFLMQLRPEFLDYYMDFMGESYDVKEHQVDPNPDLSIILLTKDAHSWIVDTLEFYAKFKKLSCEFILIDEGSQDSTMNIATKFAEKDKRFIVRMNEARSAGAGNGERIALAEQMRMAIENARGTYTVFIPSNYVVGERLLHACVLGAQKSHADIALPDAGNVHCEYLLRRMREMHLPLPDASAQDPDALRGPIYGPFAAADIPDLAFASNLDYGWMRLYRTAFLKQDNIQASAEDVAISLYSFGGMAMLAAKSIAFLDLKNDWHIIDRQRQQVGEAFWLSLVKIIPYTSEPEAVLPAVLAFGDYMREQNVYEVYEQGYLNAVLSAFMRDMRSRFTPEGIESYMTEYCDRISSMLDITHRGALYYYDTEAFNDFQKITLSGSMDLWLEERALHDEDGIFYRDKVIRDLEASTRLRIGTRVVDSVKRLSPSGFIARAQAKARLNKRR